MLTPAELRKIRDVVVEQVETAKDDYRGHANCDDSCDMRYIYKNLLDAAQEALDLIDRELAKE